MSRPANQRNITALHVYRNLAVLFNNQLMVAMPARIQQSPYYNGRETSVNNQTRLTHGKCIINHSRPASAYSFFFSLNYVTWEFRAVLLIFIWCCFSRMISSSGHSDCLRDDFSLAIIDTKSYSSVARRIKITQQCIHKIRYGSVHNLDILHVALPTLNTTGKRKNLYLPH